MKLNNPHKGAVHVHHQLTGKSITLKPGLNEVSECQMATFGKDLANSGVEILENLHDCAEAKMPEAPKPMPEAPKPLPEKLEKLNDIAEALPAKKPAKKVDLSE